jgi:hypothetical protein
MSDSPLEEIEAQDRAKDAHEASQSSNPLVSRVTLTIAVLAVAAAVVASLETSEGDFTIVSKNDAVLEQNRATDQWNFYEAKSLKKSLYGLAAEQGGPKAAEYAKVAAKNGADQADIQKEAKAHEAKRDSLGEIAERHERRHGRLTIASTLLHMAIAIATLAILLGRPWPWIASIVLTAAGAGIAVWAYL